MHWMAMYSLLSGDYTYVHSIATYVASSTCFIQAQGETSAILWPFAKFIYYHMAKCHRTRPYLRKTCSTELCCNLSDHIIASYITKALFEKNQRWYAFLLPIPDKS